MSGEEKDEIPTWADPEGEAKSNVEKTSTPKENKEELPYWVQKIIDAIDDKNAQTAHHLDRIATVLEKRIAPALEKIANQQPVTYVPPKIPTPAPTPVPTPTPMPKPPFMTQIMDLFPEDLKDMLSFNGDGNKIIIRPRRFLGADNFAKIASIVRNAGGEYISAGKESHFKVEQK